MAYEQKNNGGVLFKNTYKKTDAQPDYTGDAMFNGVKGRISSWIKEGAKGKFLSIAFTPESEMPNRDAPTLRKPAPTLELDEIDDEIPF